MAVKKVPGDPGPTEYSWGQGIMADPALGYRPTTAEQLHSLHRVQEDPKNLDPTAAANYDDVIVPNQKLPE